MTREEFNELIDKYLSGQASPAEEKLMDDFFAVQEKKQILPHYRLSEEMWLSIEEKMKSRPVLSNKKQKAGFSFPKKFSRRNVLIPLLFCLILGGVYYLKSGIFPDAPEAWVTSESPKGQKSLITLADGSRIFLNSASMVSYPETFESDKREIVLTGEAFFEIARDENRPLMVRSGNVTTRVLGTSFNIEAFEGEPTKVTVATGKVEVNVESNPGNKNGSHVILTPNQQAVYDVERGLVMKNVSADRFIAWKSHSLYFDNNTLEEVATQLERWYNVSIEFENDQIKNCRVNGQYKEMELRKVLKSIQYMYPIQFRFSGQNKIVLYGKGCDR